MPDAPEDLSGLTLARECGPLDQARPGKKARNRGNTEQELRNAVELWGRARWPEARVCHEIVMDRGTVRLDVAFVSPNHLAVVELKSGYDTMERAIHQIGMARLAANEVWLICDERYRQDMKLVRYLIPSLGIASCDAYARHRSDGDIRIQDESVLGVEPHPEAQGSVLWVAELLSALGFGPMARPPSHASLVRRFAALRPDVRTELVCRELRGRQALWRADPPEMRKAADLSGSAA